jgi:hypothetical protein
MSLENKPNKVTYKVLFLISIYNSEQVLEDYNIEGEGDVEVFDKSNLIDILPDIILSDQVTQIDACEEDETLTFKYVLELNSEDTIALLDAIPFNDVCEGSMILSIPPGLLPCVVYSGDIEYNYNIQGSYTMSCNITPMLQNIKQLKDAIFPTDYTDISNDILNRVFDNMVNGEYNDEEVIKQLIPNTI